MRHLFSKLFSAYRVDYPKRLAYMWQSSEYSVNGVLRWWIRIRSFASFTKRGDLVLTRASRIVRYSICSIALLYFILNVLSIIIFHNSAFFRVVHAVGALVLYSPLVVLLSIVPVLVLRLFRMPMLNRRIRKAAYARKHSTALVIAVAGSYGKTSMKEFLVSVLSTQRKVAATSGNRNTLLSQADFLLSLDRDVEYLVIEFGEGGPEDIAKMVELCQPNYAVITGLAPNHLDKYNSLDEVTKDLAVLADYVGTDKLFMNADSNELFSRLGTKGRNYSSNAGFDGWSVQDVGIRVDALSFELEKCGQCMQFDSKLVGEHNVGPLSFVAGFAAMIGIDISIIETAINQLAPYEHRMQPRKIGGAWFIDDTYNGNIEGLIAGLTYLKQVKVKGKKLYATPGLVDQGSETVAVHKKLGVEIGKSNINHVYLMRNSVTDIIKSAIASTKFSGKLTIIDDPLSFYLNIQDILADGDIVLCQNDWPDIYG